MDYRQRGYLPRVVTPTPFPELHMSANVLPIMRKQSDLLSKKIKQVYITGRLFIFKCLLWLDTQIAAPMYLKKYK